MHSPQGFDGGLPGRRHDVGVLAAHVFESSGFLVEVPHRVSAQQRKPVPLREAIPQHLEPDGRMRASLFPEDIDHFSVGANQQALVMFTEQVGDETADACFEPYRVGHVAFHEEVERLLRVEHDERARVVCLLDIDALAFQTVEDGRAMVFGRNDDRGMTVLESLTQKAGNGRKQTVLVPVELDGMVMVVKGGLGDH